MTEAPPRTAREVLARARPFLERHGVEAARLEAELLVAHALGRSRLQLFLDLDRPVDGAELDRARALLVRRSRGEPTAYLLGRREFYGRDFEVGPGVLVPRPETELLVDRGRELLAGRAAPRVADLGTGSGCLAVTLALEVPGSEVLASDESERALAFARRNVERHGARVRLLPGDGLAPLRPHAPFDLLVSNPPYVDPADAPGLPREVREHEPPEALFAPAGAPDHWAELLIAEGPELLAPEGTLLVELGIGQAARLAPRLERAAAAGARWALHADLAGVERVMELAPPAS